MPPPLSRARAPHRIIPVLYLMAILSTPAMSADQAAWIYLLDRGPSTPGGPSTLSVIDPQTGSLIQRLPLSGTEPAGIYPTPGGKYLFVTFRQSGLISVVDVETHREAKTLSLAEPPGTLSFTPMGNQLYIVPPEPREQSTLWVFHHSGGELELQERRAVEGTAAPILFNRRGTRFYLSNSDGLAVVYAKTGEIIKRINVPGGPLIWAFAPDYRYLWGIGLESGLVAVVDEPKARVVKRLELAVKPRKAVFAWDGREVYLIGRSGERIMVLDRKSLRLKGEIPLPLPIDRMTYTGKGMLWAISTDGRMALAVDTASGAVSNSIALPGQPQAIRYISLKKGQGYACF